MCYILDLWYLSHAFTGHVKYTTTHPLPLVPHIILHTSLWMPWWFIYHARLGPISWEVCGLDGGHPCIWITVQAYHTLPIHSQDMRKGWQHIHDHLTSYQIPHLPADGFVVCRSCKTLAHGFGGLSPAWRASQCMDYIPDLRDLSHVFIRHVKCMTTHPLPLVPHIISHTSLWMPWQFAHDPVSPGPTSWEVCGLDGGHPFVWTASQACQTLHMHQQDISKWVETHPWPSINHIRNHTSL